MKYKKILFHHFLKSGLKFLLCNKMTPLQNHFHFYMHECFRYSHSTLENLNFLFFPYKCGTSLILINYYQMVSFSCSKILFKTSNLALFSRSCLFVNSLKKIYQFLKETPYYLIVCYSFSNYRVLYTECVS